MWRLGARATGIIAIVVNAAGAGEQNDAPTRPRVELSRETLFADDAGEALAGTEVVLDDVTVREKAGNGMWIGYEPGRELFAVPIDPSLLETLAVGARIDVRGTLKKALAPRQAARAFALDAAATRRYAEQRLYIDAWSITDLR
jgi:hypothetical protein